MIFRGLTGFFLAGIYPVGMKIASGLFLSFLIFCGIVVVGDSPQFSTLVANISPNELVGSALTIVNCIGFSITIVSIQLMTWLIPIIPSDYLFLFLVIGPLIGLGSLRPLVRKKV